MASQRQRLSQLYEEASTGSRLGGRGHLDLDVLNARAGDIYQLSGVLTPERRSAARSVTPHEALATIDDYMREVETWDSLPFEVLNQHAEEAVAAVQRSPAWLVVRPLLSGYRDAFLIRGRARTTRSATLLTAYMWRYRLETGHWPETLSDALPHDARVGVTDPFVGRSFGYNLADGRPALYSLNEDGRDDGGRNGVWEEAGTDIVFFQPRCR
jgi:hypothetical protein